MKRTKEEIFDLIDDGLERYTDAFVTVFSSIYEFLQKFILFTETWKFPVLVGVVIFGMGFVKGIIECIKVYLL